jgi:tetratricopeptide (TPR) repeat protein
MDRDPVFTRFFMVALVMLAAGAGCACPRAALGASPAGGTAAAIRAGYERIDRGDAAGAHAHFRALAERDPGDLAAALGTLCALEALGLDEPQPQQEFERRAEQLLALARRRYDRNHADREALFHLSLGYGRRAIYRYNHDKGLWGTARDAAQSRMYGEAYRKIDAGRDDIYVVLGFYNYYIAIAPAFLRFLQPLLGLPRGDRAEGLRQLERVARDGDLFRSDARYELVTIYMVEGRPADALRAAEQLAQEYPDAPRAGEVLAMTCLGSPVGDYRRAEQVLLAMLRKIDEGHPHYRSKERYRVLRLLAIALREQWRIEEAVATLSPVIQAGTERPDWVLPRFLLWRGAFRSLLDELRATEDAQRVLAGKKWAGRFHKEAKEQLEEIARERKSGESAVYAGLIPANRLAAERRWDEADAAYRRLRERHPGDWQVRFRQACLEYERDSLDRALAGFREIVESVPAAKPAWVRSGATLYLARTHDLLGQRQEAIRCYKKILSDHEKDGDALAARIGLLAPYRRISG